MPEGSRAGVWEASPPPHQLGGLRERCDLSQWGSRGGRAPAARRFSCILDSPDGSLSETVNGTSVQLGCMLPLQVVE